MKSQTNSQSKKANTSDAGSSAGTASTRASKKSTTTSASATSTSSMKVAGVIGGIAAAAAVGGYFLYHNKDAQKKVKSIKGWVLKAKGEVLEKIENLKEVNQEAYQKAVDTVLAKYEKLSHVDTTEIAKVSKELKSHWKSIQSELGISSKKVKEVIKGARSVASSAISAMAKPTSQTASKSTASHSQKKKGSGTMKKA